MPELWDGVPASPEASGWHWVEDASGLRPLLWRGDDWPESADRREWEEGVVICAPSDLRGARYFGPVDLPDSVADRFRRTRLAGPRRSKPPRSWTQLLGFR
jgi:hypothetical protein